MLMSRPRRLIAALTIVLSLASSLLTVTGARAAATVVAPAHLLAAPADDSGILLALDPGAVLTIDGPPEGAFYPVTAAGVSGWIDGGVMRVDKTAPSPEPDAIGGDARDAISWNSTTPETDPASAIGDESLAITADAPVNSDDASGASGIGPETPADAPPTDGQAEQPAAVEPAALPTEEPVAAPSGEPTAHPEPAAAATVTATPEDSSPPPDASPSSDSPPDPDPKQPEMRRNGPTTVLVDAPLLESADPHSGLVFTVPAGSTFNLYGDEANGYLYGEFMWMFGWIRADQLDPAERVRDERIDEDVETVDTKTPKPGAGTAWTTVDLTLRAGPSAAEDALDTVPAGTRIDLTGVMQNDFQRVVYNDQVGWLSNDYLELPKDPEPEVKPNGRPVWTEKEIITIIEDAADRYGQPREDMLRVARCESNLDPYAVNPSGSYGLFQFVRSTWESTPFADKDIFDPVANANAAGWMWKEGRRSEWVCH